tara:strand:+ start:202 stop:450 length:249 start_codon:yes stop_codon:yes gene_type:complete
MKVTFELEEKELCVLIDLMQGHCASEKARGKKMMPYWESDDHELNKMEIAGHKDRLNLAEGLTHKLVKLYCDEFWIIDGIDD